MEAMAMRSLQFGPARACPPPDAAASTSSSRGSSGDVRAAVSSPESCSSRSFSSRPLTRFGSSFFQRSRGGIVRSRSGRLRGRGSAAVVCGLQDFIGGDLMGFDLDRWYDDVENYGSIAVYAPPEGGVEGRYVTRLKREGYRFMTITARGLGDVESCLTKIHGVRPAHLGKQKIETFYYPPELDHRLSALPEDSKGLVLWIIEAKVLSTTELQYLALLPAYRPKVKVIAEVGTWRSYRWKPLRTVAGLPLTPISVVALKPKGGSKAEQTAVTPDSKAEDGMARQRAQF